MITVDGEPAATINPVTVLPRRLTFREVEAYEVLADALVRLCQPHEPFDAVALIGEGRR